MTHLSSTKFGWLAAAALWCSFSVSAGEAVAEEAGRAEIREGEQAFQRGDFDAALDAFRSAYEDTDMTALLYNIGMCEWELDRPVDAVRSFRRYLAAAPDLSAGDRREIEEILDELRPRHGDLIVRVSPPEAAVAIDDIEIAGTPGSPVAVTAGGHTVVVTLEGYEHTELVRSVDAGATTTVDVRLVAIDDENGTGDDSVDEPLVNDPQAPQERRRPWWFWTGVGLAGASAIATAVTGGLTLGYQGDYEDSGQLDIDAYDAGQRLAVTTDVLLGVSVGAATVALIAIIVHAVRDRRRRASWAHRWTLASETRGIW